MKVYYITMEHGNGMSGPDDRRKTGLYTTPELAYTSMYWFEDQYKDKLEITVTDCNDGLHTKEWGYLKIINVQDKECKYRHWTYYLKEEEVLSTIEF